MQFILIVLRLIHIVTGTFWVGSALMLALVLLPGIRKAGPGGARALPMAKLSMAMSISSHLTVLAGLILFGVLSGLSSGWIRSPYGIGLSIGAAAGLVALLIGLIFSEPTAKRLGALGGEIQAAGGPPRPTQAAELGRLQAKLSTSSTWSTALATASLALMAVARYL